MSGGESRSGMGSGESWFEPRRGNSKRDAMARIALRVFRVQLEATRSRRGDWQKGRTLHGCRPQSHARGAFVKKRLILCFDGTWEMRPSLRPRRKGSYPTNVEKIQIAVLREDDSVVPAVAQVTAYYPGVGTGRLSHVWGGMTGAGISRTICDAYAFIVDNFIMGEDHLYLFGFSR